jgi:hypothetical protein
MNYLYVILFFLLTPGILVSLPPGGSKYTVAFVHALVFGLITWFVQSRMKSTYDPGKKY